MELGETLQILEGIIYEKAKRELEAAETPLSLRTIVMDAVAAKFKEEAYERNTDRSAHRNAGRTSERIK